MCVSAFQQKAMIVKVVFFSTIVLCLVLLQTFTFFLLSFSTVICYFMIFIIILNRGKLLEVCCGVKQKQKYKAETKAERGSKWLTKQPVLLALGRHFELHILSFLNPPLCFLPKCCLGAKIWQFPVKLVPRFHWYHFLKWTEVFSFSCSSNWGGFLCCSQEAKVKCTGLSFAAVLPLVHGLRSWHIIKAEMYLFPLNIR